MDTVDKNKRSDEWYHNQRVVRIIVPWALAMVALMVVNIVFAVYDVREAIDRQQDAYVADAVVDAVPAFESEGIAALGFLARNRESNATAYQSALLLYRRRQSETDRKFQALFVESREHRQSGVPDFAKTGVQLDPTSLFNARQSIEKRLLSVNEAALWYAEYSRRLVHVLGMTGNTAFSRAACLTRAMAEITVASSTQVVAGTAAMGGIARGNLGWADFSRTSQKLAADEVVDAWVIPYLPFSLSSEVEAIRRASYDDAVLRQTANYVTVTGADAMAPNATLFDSVVATLDEMASIYLSEASMRVNDEFGMRDQTAAALAIEIAVLLAVVMTCAFAVGKLFHKNQVNTVTDDKEYLSLIESKTRMESFVAKVCAMELTDMQVHEGKDVHPAEVALNKVYPALCQLAQYVHPSLLHQRDELGGLRFDPNLEGYAMSAMVVDCSTFNSKSQDTLNPKAQHENIRRVYDVVGEEVRLRGGAVHRVVGGRFIALWNVATPSVDAATSACECALELSRKITAGSAFSTHRIAVVTGDSLAGVLGSDTLRVFPCFSPALAMSSMLLRTAALHDAPIVVDHATFLDIDSQTLGTRPLEQIQLTKKTMSTTVHELTTTLASGSGKEYENRMVHWTSAFAFYTRDHFSGAKESFEEFRQKYPTHHRSSVERLIKVTGLEQRPTIRSTEMTAHEELM